MKVISLNWRCVWRLIWHGSEIVRMPDGETLEFRWVPRKAMTVKAVRDIYGDGCYVHIEPKP
jgi:hypothetical protein